MNFDIDALLTRARLSSNALDSAERGAAGSPADERMRLERLASEFESMLIAQMLRDMRRAGRWDEGGDDNGDGFAATPLFELLDTELAAHIARAQGLGLTPQLLDTYDRLQGAGRDGGAAAPVPARPGVLPGLPGLAALPVAPVDAAVITSPFGWRLDPFTGEARFHRGVDLRAAYGVDVKAAGDGRVVFSGAQGGYGTSVVVAHADGTQTRYAHLSAALVETGDLVAAGQPVGQAGSSGRATGPHVHFERLDRDGRPLNPSAGGG